MASACRAALTTWVTAGSRSRSAMSRRACARGLPARMSRSTERFLRAEKLALQAPVKMLFPLIAFIFPCTFLVLFFPIVMKLMHAGL